MARTDVTYAYAADIVKSERDPETGDLMVYGKATGPDLDLDGQICDPKWLKSAMPAWMEWGNVREMHGPSAVGVGVTLDEVGQDWYLAARIVDKVAAEKVEKGVYKGYSIGIKNAQAVRDSRAPGGRIIGGETVEVSLVDRPCNPTAKMSIAKGVGLAEDGASIEVDDDALRAPVALGPVEIEAEPAPEPEVEKVVAPVAESGGNAALGRILVAKVNKTVGADVTKASPEADIASAQEAIMAVARLIISEAEGLAAGNMADASQISTLLRAIDALCWFQCQESMEEESVVVESVELAATANSGHGTSTADTEDSKISDMVKAAVAEVGKAHEEELKALRAELAKVKAQPIPGGPVLARPRAVIAEAEGREREATARAEQYEQLAKAYAVTDPRTAQGYRQMAQALRPSTKD